MNGSTQPSQLVEQVKTTEKGSVHILEWVLSAQSSVGVTWLEEEVLPFTVHLAVSWLWCSFTACLLVLKSLLQLKNSGKRGRKKHNEYLQLEPGSTGTSVLEAKKPRPINLFYFL